ncbi:hypothetical protein D3C71_1401980 [compost metagenome]
MEGMTEIEAFDYKQLSALARINPVSVCSGVRGYFRLGQFADRKLELLECNFVPRLSPACFLPL